MRLVPVRTALALTILAALALATSGCQMSRSSSRIFASMASVWSLSASFQSSFGGRRAGLDEDYAFDIAALGASAATAGTADERLVGDVSRVAESHGVTDWEALEETWLGLGIGLRHVGMSAGDAHALVRDVFGEEMAARTVAAAYLD